MNAKSLTVPAIISDGPIVRRDNSRLNWTDTLPYDKVRGLKSADEIANTLAKEATDTAE